ncbi:MAG: hypothetical protein ABIJ05_02670 [Patescibacteria group bacterium]
MRKYLLGIELSDLQIKITCLEKDNSNKYRLCKLDKLAFGKSETQTVEALQKWLKENFPDKSIFSAILALPESSIFLKEISLPNLKGKQMKEAIYWELASIAPIAPTEAIYEWLKISEEKNKVKVLAMVVKNQIVEKYLSIFKQAGIRVLAIEPFSISFSRVARADFNKTTLLLIVQERESNLVILKKGIPVFSTSLAVTLEGMKKRKRKLKKEIIADLARSAKKTISFWELKEKDSIKQVIITGDIVNKYYGLAKAINHFAHIPALIARGRKLKNISTDGQNGAKLSQFLVPFGSALRLFAGDESRVNLLPVKEKELLEKEIAKEEIIKKAIEFTKLNLVFLLAIFLIFIAFKIVNINLTKDISKLNQQIQIHPAQSLISKVFLTNQILSNVEVSMAQQKDMGAKLKLIAQLTPENISFNSIDYSFQEKEKWEISGIGDRNDILAFYEKLKNESGADEVTMPYSSFEKEKGSDFSVILTW